MAWFPGDRWGSHWWVLADDGERGAGTGGVSLQLSHHALWRLNHRPVHPSSHEKHHRHQHRERQNHIWHAAQRYWDDCLTTASNDQTFAVRPVTHDQLHAFRRLIYSLDFLANKISVSIIVQLQLVLHILCLSKHKNNFDISWRSLFWTEAVYLYLFIQKYQWVLSNMIIRYLRNVYFISQISYHFIALHYVLIIKLSI